jgi:hypothetical protein
MDRSVFEKVFLESTCACNPAGPRGRHRCGGHLLVWTSLSFLAPIVVLYRAGVHVALLAATVCLLCTSLVYHSTHNRVVRACDVFMCMVSWSTGATLLIQEIQHQFDNAFLGAALACFIVSGSIITCKCFYGKYDPSDPDDPQKMIRLIPHACMHIFTASAFTMLGLAKRGGSVSAARAVEL